jgi:hypothetical protein
MSKIKFRLEVWGSTVLFQVLEMDERFRCRVYDEKLDYISKKAGGFFVVSQESPYLGPKYICLRGLNKDRDDDVGQRKIYGGQREAESYAQNIYTALKDWAENWEGWGEEKDDPEALPGKVYEF